MSGKRAPETDWGIAMKKALVKRDAALVGIFAALISTFVLCLSHL